MNSNPIDSKSSVCDVDANIATPVASIYILTPLIERSKEGSFFHNTLPEFTLNDSENVVSGLDVPETEHLSYEDRWNNVITLIEDGTLKSDEECKYLSPQISAKDKSAKEIEEMRNLPVGEKLQVSSSWTYEFYLYNSPKYGMMLVYNNMSNNCGWYKVDVESLLRHTFCEYH